MFIALATCLLGSVYISCGYCLKSSLICVVVRSWLRVLSTEINQATWGVAILVHESSLYWLFGYVE